MKSPIAPIARPNRLQAPSADHSIRWPAMGADLDSARETLLAELREHALVIGEVTLSSGQTASTTSTRRASPSPPRPSGRRRAVATEAAERGATAVGGMTMGADPLACAAIAAERGDG